jgi:hypothetical protein
MNFHPGYYYSFVLDLVLYDTTQNRALSLMIANLQLRDEQQRLLANFHKSVPVFKAFSSGRSIISNLYILVSLFPSSRTIIRITYPFPDSEHLFLAPLAGWLLLFGIGPVRSILSSFPKLLPGKNGTSNKTHCCPTAEQIHTSNCMEGMQLYLLQVHVFCFVFSLLPPLYAFEHTLACGATFSASIQSAPTWFWPLAASPSIFRFLPSINVYK